MILTSKSIIPIFFGQILCLIEQHAVEDVVAQAGYRTIRVYYSTNVHDVTIAHVITTHTPCNRSSYTVVL